MVPHAHGLYPMALPGMMSSFCTGLPGMPPVYPPLCLRHGSLLSIPFRSHRRLPACGGSLFRAYRMRAPAPAFAPARLCAPDCAREPSAGRRSPARSVGVFFRAGARRETKRPPDAASSCFILSCFCEGQAFMRNYFNFSTNKLLSSITDPILPFAKRFHPGGLIPAGSGLTPGAEPDKRRPPCAISGTWCRNMS